MADVGGGGLGGTGSAIVFNSSDPSDYEWQTIPLDNIDGAPRFLVVSQLSSVEYRFRFEWLHRFGMWALDMVRTSGEIVMLGQVCTANQNMLRQIATIYRPPGPLFFEAADGLPPGLVDIGTRALFRYGAPRG